MNHLLRHIKQCSPSRVWQRLSVSVLAMSMALTLVGSLGFASSAYAAGDGTHYSDHQVDEAQRWGVNMTESVTAVGKEIFDLHMLIF